MPQRSKEEAELRMAMHVARLARVQGKNPREAIQAIKDHLLNVRRLENAAPVDPLEKDAPQPIIRAD
ncbi:UNVERIFIED_ORG: hypothetical protein LHK14_26050 (plasmid) [Roseateles sp. XES5]|nr:hypothetical protein [Roseateles sp. XES5]